MVLIPRGREYDAAMEQYLYCGGSLLPERDGSWPTLLQRLVRRVSGRG